MYKFKKVITVLTATGGGLIAYSYLSENRERKVHNSWTTKHQNPSTRFSPIFNDECSKWDYNWDLREPSSLVKPSKHLNDHPNEQNRYNEALEKSKSKAIRHIILVRHGEYLEIGNNDTEKILTDVGRYQAKLTGERLKALDIKWDRIVSSTLTRARETAHLIVKALDIGINRIENCSLIKEGAPIPPQPPVGHWKPEATFFRDGPRIEAGFRRYFHRAEPEQDKDTFTLLVCHGNVIRYFVCRALQFPPEAWLRLSLNHASITWISILPSGRVTLRAFGDSGHMPPDLLTHKAIHRHTK